jgi:hypothetical protein
MSVDLVSDFAGEMRRPVGHSLTWKCGRVLGTEKRGADGRREYCNGSFHLLSLLFVSIKLDSNDTRRIRVHLTKLRVESGPASATVRCR